MSEGTRRFRRRVSHGHTTARRRYLSPELREEAEDVRATLDKMIAKLAGPKRVKRVKRMREGATARESRSARWREQTLFHEFDE